jgi:hypothetical protein
LQERRRRKNFALSNQLHPPDVDEKSLQVSQIEGGNSPMLPVNTGNRTGGVKKNIVV